MASLMSILFGGVKETAKQRRDERRQGRKLRVETLELRQMLAAGTVVVDPMPTSFAVSPNYVQTTNMKVVKLDALPGTQNAVLAAVNLSTLKGQVSRLTDMYFVGIAGHLSWDTNSISLRADMNGKASDGCEATIAYAYADYNTDMVHLTVSQPFWVGSTARRVELVCNINTSLNSEVVGVQLAEADFFDIRGRAVSEDHVRYAGVAPVVHKLESAGFWVSQRWQPETSVIYAGAKDVQVFSFDMGANLGDKPILVQNAEFVASQGDLRNCERYSLWTTRYQQGMGTYVTTCLQSGVSPVNGKVSFTNGGKGFVLDGGYQFEVRADVANTLAANPTLSLTFGSGWKARELNTGKALRGVAIGNGAGQMRFYTSQSPVFNFKPATPAGLYVSEIKTGYGWEVSTGAKDLVFDAIDVYAKGDGAVLTQVVVAAAQGDLQNCVNYALWWKSNGVSCILAMGNIVDDKVVFDFKFHVAENFVSRLEVHADLAATPVTNSLRLKTTGVVCTASGTGESFAVVDGIYAQDQPLWSWQLPSSSPTEIENLLAQIAALQARLSELQVQLSELQGNGKG